MKKRTGTATWREAEGRWRIKVQKNGTQKCFYSNTPGRTGQREANAKADAWLDDSVRLAERRYQLYTMSGWKMWPFQPGRLM